MAWAPDYASLVEFQGYARTDASDDVEAGFAIAAASRGVDYTTNRQFGQVDASEERFYEARPDYKGGYWVVDIDDLYDATGVVVVVDSDPLTTFRFEPMNAPAEGKPYERLVFTSESEFYPTGAVGEISVTSDKWGWPAIPSAVIEATLIQAFRLFTRRSAPFGVAGSPDSGSEVRLLAKLDPDLVTSLAWYRRMRKPG